MILKEGSYKDVITVLIKNRENDFFNCVAITGQVRLGKSRLAYLLSKGTYQEFSYEKNYIGNPKHGETWDTLNDTPHKSTCWLDEAAKVLSSERRFDKEQWYLQQLFNQFASHNKTIILCTPTFLEIDPRWRRSHITIWIHVFQRGKAVIMRNRFIQSSLDTWGLRNMQEKEMNMRSDEMFGDRILKNFDENPCALFYFSFPDWGPEEKTEYLKFKEESQRQLASESKKWRKTQQIFENQSRSEIGLARISAYLYWKYSIPYREIGVLSGFSDEKIRETVNQFMEKVEEGLFNEENLPKKYFDQDFYLYVKNTMAQKPGL